MSKEKLAAVRELISQKRFSEARSILETIDGDPMAQKLLDQLNRKAPRSRPRRSGGCLGYIVTVLVSALLTIGLIAVLVVVTVPSNPAAARLAAATGPDNNDAPASQVTEAPTPTDLPLVTIGEVLSAQSVNMRGGPGTNFERLGSLNAGVQVIVIGANDDSSWLNVRLPDNSEGWIRSDLLNTSEVPVTLTPEGAQGVAPVDEAAVAATSLPTCTPEEAQAWWDEHPLYFSVGHVALTAQENPGADYAALKFRLENDLYNFDIAPSPTCVASVRQNVLAGGDEVVAALNDYLAGSAEAGSTRITAARTTYLVPVVETLQTEWGITVSATDCGAEFWYGSLRPSFTQFSQMVDTVDITAANSDTIRTELFRLQDIEREVEGYYFPLCAANAQASVSAALDAGIELYRAVYEGNQNAVQDARSSSDSNRNALNLELTRLGIGL